MLPSVTKKYADHSTEREFQFDFFCDRCGAVWKSDVYPFYLKDSVWYGQYGQRTQNIFNDIGNGGNLINTDSGMAWSWINRTIPANSTQTYNVKFIIAEKGSENNVASSGTISLIRIGAVQHSFAVYQLMDGSVDNNNTYASIMNWGSGITSYEKLDGTRLSTAPGAMVPLNALVEFVESDENAEKTALIERITVGTPIRTGTSVNGSIAFPNLPCGYYLIRDTTVLSDESGDIVSRDLLVYLDDEGRAIELKRVKPSFDKSVAIDGMAGLQWAEAADYAFGENFNFKLTASIPANEDFGGYSTYQFIFHDAYSSGIDFVGIHSVTYTVGSGEPQAIAAENYTLSLRRKEFSLTIGNFAAVAGSAWGSAENAIHVDVIYTAQLNRTAPTINESVLDASYTAVKSLVSSNHAFLQYSNNPTNHASLGRTAEDYVGVFSYQLLNTKYANFATNGYQLDGATFKLYRNTVSDETEIFMVYDEALHAYRPTIGDEASDRIVSGYGLNDPQYKGKLDMMGIDAGTYVLVETQAPNGYTPIDGITFTIHAVAEENPAGTGAVDTLSVWSGAENPDEADKGGTPGAATSLRNDIINILSSNHTLPETGGIGTKIFYVIGTIMVVGAGIILIVKKRFRKHDKD